MDKDTLEVFKHSHNGKTFESPIFDHMFRLRVYPNGETIKNKGFTSVYLKLCVVPSCVSKMNVKFTMKCDQTDANYSANKEFSFDKRSDGEKKFMRLTEIETFESVTFTVDFDIVNVEFIAMEEERDLHWVYGAVQMDNVLASVSNDEDVMVKQMKFDKKLETLTKNMNANNDVIKEMQKNMNQMMQQMKDIESIIIGSRKSNEELDDEKVSTKYEDVAPNDNQAESVMVKWMKETVKLPQYVSLFNENGLDDMETIKSITMKELIMIGVGIVGHRIKIINEIEKWNQK
eukprot:256293_1